MATTRFLCAGVIAAVIAGAGLAGALPEVYSKQGRYPVTTTVLTVQRSEGIGLPFQCTVYYPTNEGAGGGRCTDVASCYLQSIGTAQNAPVADAGNFPLVAFGLNTFISGQEVYGSTMRHIASHGFVVAATNSRYIQPAAEAIEMVDCINELEKQQTQASSKFHNKLDLKAGVGVLGYSQGGAASLDTAARLGDRCSGCITQHAQPSMMASQIKCPVFLHSGDQDSLTGIMKAMIWSGVRTPKVFAIMRGAHHLTPVPPSPWDPWSLAWLSLYLKGDAKAGEYIWGSAATVGSLRSLQMSGAMTETLFDPAQPWSQPYTQYGLRGSTSASPALPAGTPGQQIQTTPAPAGVSSAGAGQMMPSFSSPQPGGSMFGSMFGGAPGGTSGSASGLGSSPFSFLRSLMGRYSPTAAAGTGQAGLGNTLTNTAGSLTSVTNIPVAQSQETILVDAVQTRTDQGPSLGLQQQQQQPVSRTQEEVILIDQSHTWSPIRRVTAPKQSDPIYRPVTQNQPSLRPVPAAALMEEDLSQLYLEQEGREVVKKRVRDKQVRDLSDTLGGPYCETSFDCCHPGQCTLVVGTVMTTNMCSLPAGGLGKLATDPTCRRVSTGGSTQRMPPVSPAPSPAPGSDSMANRYALAPKSMSGAPSLSTGAPFPLLPPSGGARGPRLELRDCGAGSMTLRVSEMSPASTIVVLGSIYVPKQQQVDQLVLLSNSQCPVIDVNVKVPRQHLSKQFLKTRVVEAPARAREGEAQVSGLVTFGNDGGDACADFVYQAIDVTRCVAGPVLDLR